jgi:diacylglycerol kinase (ATP)
MLKHPRPSEGPYLEPAPRGGQHGACRERWGARALRIGVLHNTKSGKNRRGRQCALLPERSDVLQRDAHTPRDIARALDEFAHTGVGLVVINGGDGTVQAVLTRLFTHNPFPHLPLLAALPAGTTNMTAGDVGLKGNRTRALRRLMAWAEHPQHRAAIKRRAVLCVQTGAEQGPLYGMFFGTAAIMHGIQFCRQNVHTKGVRGELGPGLAMASLMFDLMRGNHRHMRPENISVKLDTAPPVKHRSMVLLISTLERLFLGLRPYWGQGHGPLYYTMLETQPRHLARVLPALLRGKPHARLTGEHGYSSHKVNRVELRLDCGFTLDGELHHPASQSGPLVISHGGDVCFVQV